MRRYVYLLVGCLCLGLSFATAADAAPGEFEVSSFDASLTTDQAGAHPDFTTSFVIASDAKEVPNEPAREVTFDLPPGLTGNVAAFPTCSAVELTALNFETGAGACPQGSQIGVTRIVVNNGFGGIHFVEPIYNMGSPGGGTVARFGFYAANFPVYINVHLVPEDGYRLRATVQGLSSFIPLVAASTTLWGVPSDESHDPDRITPYEAASCGGRPCTAPGELPRHSGLRPIPFMTNPTHCGAPLDVAMSASSYLHPQQSISKVSSLGRISGCGALSFEPKITLAPTVKAADTAGGMNAEVTLPQPGLELSNVLATAHLKKAIVTLPRGLSLNPAAAGGLGACTEAQIGLIGEAPIRFNVSEPSCPESAKVGTVEIHTQILPQPLKGTLYLASQSDNPFHTLLSGYLVAEGDGAIVKLAGRFDANPATGQLTASFDQNPEQPFDDLQLHFKGGNRGVLVTPPSCGSYAIQSSLSPWSADDPESPTEAETVTSSSVFSIDRGADEAGCSSPGFRPRLEVGTTNPTAGDFSPFLLRLSREDGTQRLRGIEATFPPGLVGRLAGVPYCPDSALGAVSSAVGTGVAELSSPHCPAASQVGSVSVGAGAGSPFYVNTGKAYLAGPYKGAPLSLAVVTPAIAGPFDLGSVVVRDALFVDPSTAQLKAVSDPLPAILAGIPLDLRDVRVMVDRPDFMLNPTSCERMAVAATVSSETGSKAALSEPFQVGSCASLGFKPRLSLGLNGGGTKRTGHPSLKVVVRPRKGDANIARVSVALPHSEFLDQAHIGTICTRPQFAAGTCPKASIYGYAKAFTPLLAKPLQGPVYLRSSNHRLPDLVAALNGQVSLALDGRIDSVHGGIRNTFEVVPDAPVSKFVLTMQGGKKGLLVNSRDICAATYRATVRMRGQNGRSLDFRPPLKAECGRGKGPKHKHHQTTKHQPEREA